MPYEKQTVKFVAGGINVLLPGDQIDDSEAQVCKNFSFDSAGALRSRKGHTLRFSAGATVVAMTRALGGVWAAAGGSVLFEGSAIITGVSSDLVGLVGWMDFLWAMSAGGQQKSDGSSNWQWLAVPPTDKPAADTTTESTIQVVDFSAGFSVTPSGDESYAPTLELIATSSVVYSATKTISADFATGGTLDDIFRIRVFCKQWNAVNALAFDIDVNDGSFTLDYYTGYMAAKDIQEGGRDTVTFHIRKRPLDVDSGAKDKKRYGYMLRIGQTPSKNYSTAVAVRVKADMNAKTTIRWDSWELIGDSGHPIEGDDIQWYYTWTTDAGHETDPSPISDPITINRGAGALTNIGVSVDSQITKVNFYRTGGNLGAVYETPDSPKLNGVTDYTDGNADDDLTNLNIQLEDDHDQPPVVGGLIGPFFGRLIAFGGNKYYWSHLNKPYAFRGPLLADGDWEAVDETVGDLLAATMQPGVIWMYGQAGVLVIQGDPGAISGSVFQSSCKMGIASANGVAQGPNGDGAVMNDCFALFNGGAAQILSKKVDPVFKGDAPFSKFDASSAAVGYRNGIFWASDGSVTYKYEMATDRWMEDTRTFTCFYNDIDSLLGATTAGDVVELESGYSDIDGAIEVTYLSKAFNGGMIDNEKRWEDFTIWADCGSEVLTVEAVTDAGTVALGTITGDGRFVLRFSSVGEGFDARTCAIQITGTVSSEVIIYKMALNYYIIAREGKAYDTAEFSPGGGKMCRLREMVFDIYNSAIADVTVKSDRPEPTADRTTGLTISLTSDRRWEPVVIAQDVKVIGRLFRLVLYGTDLRCYGGKALFQVYGTYLEGAKGEYYLSDALDFGSERVLMVKWIEITYDSSSTGTFELESDGGVRGGSFETLNTFDLAETDGEEAVILDCTGTYKGHLWRVMVTPAGNMRIESIRFWGKYIGRPNATTWEWMPLPVTPTQPAVWNELKFNQDQPG